MATVAEEMRITPGAVFVARSRVLARLRERVEQVTEDSGFELDGEGGRV